MATRTDPLGNQLTKTAEHSERTKALADLRKWFPKGATVFTILRHVARSGMRREISVVGILGKNKATGQSPLVIHPNYSVALLIGARLNRSGSRDAIIRNGCGMDMGADIVASLSYALYGEDGALRHEWL